MILKEIKCLITFTFYSILKIVKIDYDKEYEESFPTHKLQIIYWNILLRFTWFSSQNNLTKIKKSIRPKWDVSKKKNIGNRPKFVLARYHNSHLSLPSGVLTELTKSVLVVEEKTLGRLKKKQR